MASKKEPKIDLRRRFGDRVRKLREERGWTQVYLAEVAGVSKTFLSNVETGQKEPCLNTIEALADSLEISLGDFFRVL